MVGEVRLVWGSLDRRALRMDDGARELIDGREKTRHRLYWGRPGNLDANGGA